MRMWGLPVEAMCTKHRTGEHSEMHMFQRSIEMGKSVAGFIADELVHLPSIVDRHNELAATLNHNSPMEPFPLPTEHGEGRIDVVINARELARRCPDCRKLLEDYYRDTIEFGDIPKGGDKVYDTERGWRVQFCGVTLAGAWGSREAALRVIEKRRKVLHRQQIEDRDRVRKDG